MKDEYEQQIKYLKRKIKDYSKEDLKDEIIRLYVSYLSLQDEHREYIQALRKQKQRIYASDGSWIEVEGLLDLIY